MAKVSMYTQAQNSINVPVFPVCFQWYHTGPSAVPLTQTETNCRTGRVGQWLVLVLLCVAVTTRVVVKVVYDALVTGVFFSYIFVKSFDGCGCAGREAYLSIYTVQSRVL